MSILIQTNNLKELIKRTTDLLTNKESVHIIIRKNSNNMFIYDPNDILDHINYTKKEVDNCTDIEYLKQLFEDILDDHKYLTDYNSYKLRLRIRKYKCIRRLKLLFISYLDDVCNNYHVRSLK